MKIKKVNDTQIMLLLSNQDLSDRNLKISDIASNSIKAQKLFRDIMSTAVTEYGFVADESPLMIEAIPATDGITIIISKVKEAMNDDISLIPDALDSRKFLNSPITLKAVEKTPQNNIVLGSAIFEFYNLDYVIKSCIKLNKIYKGTNMLYKYKNKYYLVLNNDNADKPVMLNDLEPIISEYGKKYNSRHTELSKYLFMEHGEVIVKKDAVKILADL